VTRIEGIDPDTADETIRAGLDQQRRRWGTTFVSHRIYARRPTILAGAKGMWAGLAASGLLDGRLVALLNRRVAQHNRCEF
jgi:hypothetical protein